MTHAIHSPGPAGKASPDLRALAERAIAAPPASDEHKALVDELVVACEDENVSVFKLLAEMRSGTRRKS